MKISIRLWAVWIYLFSSAYLRSTLSKPAVQGDIASFRKDVFFPGKYSPGNPGNDDTFEYSYDWTLDSSGDLSYIDDDGQEQIPCPSYCTCLADSIVHCSRQEIVSFGGNLDGRIDANLKVLSGNIPESASAVHLGYNNLTYLPVGMFQDSTQSGENNISDLYVQKNQIKTVHPDAFVCLTKLKNLDMSNNLLTRLIQRCPDDDTYSLSSSIVSDLQCEPGTTEANFLQSAPSSLVSLNLNNNLLRGLPNHSFLSLSNLEVLRLSGNRISWISKKAFYGLHKLRILQLRGNPLGANTAAKLGEILQHFITGEQLVPSEEISLSELSSFQFYPEKYDINSAGSHRSLAKRTADMGEVKRPSADTIELNSLNELDLGDTQISKFPSVLPPSLKRLYLDSNNISSIPFKILQGAGNLELLQLGGNRIKHLRDDTFAALEILQVLDLSRNNLTRLTPRSFTGLTRLTSLRLYGNRHLSQLPRKVFWSLPYLRTLYIHDCNLRSLPPGPWLFRVMALWLYGNPIDCNCANLLSLMTRLYRPARSVLRVDPYRSISWDDSDTWEHQRPEKTMCASPPQFKGFRFVDVSVRSLGCDYEDHLRNEISQQIANSRFISADYQRDDATTVQITESLVVELEELWDNADESLNKSLVELELRSNTKYEEIGKLQARSDDLLLPEDTDTVVPKLQAVMENVEIHKLIASKEEEAGKRAPNLNDIKRPSDSHVPVTGSKYLVPEAGDGRVTATEWVIGLSAGAKVESKSQEPDFDSAIVSPQRNKSVEEHTNASRKSRGNSTSTTYSTEKDVTPHVESDLDELVDKRSFETTDIIDGVEENAYDKHPQGFAEFIYYDDGAVMPQPQFQADLDGTLSDTDLLRLQDEVGGLNGWKSYNEYYTDEGASADDEDYAQSYDQYKFGMQVQRMAANASSFADLLGNLSKMYNISVSESNNPDDPYPNGTDPESTTADLLPDEHELLFDYEDS